MGPGASNFLVDGHGFDQQENPSTIIGHRITTYQLSAEKTEANVVAQIFKEKIELL